MRQFSVKLNNSSPNRLSADTSQKGYQQSANRLPTEEKFSQDVRAKNKFS